MCPETAMTGTPGQPSRDLAKEPNTVMLGHLDVDHNGVRCLEVDEFHRLAGKS
jgi:hypothetical protein